MNCPQRLESDVEAAHRRSAQVGQLMPSGRIRQLRLGECDAFLDWSLPRRGLEAILTIGSHLSAWANVTLALAGPALVAVLGTQVAPTPITRADHPRRVGLGDPRRRVRAPAPALLQCSCATPLLAIALTAFSVLIFGQVAYWVLAGSPCNCNSLDEPNQRIDVSKRDVVEPMRPSLCRTHERTDC
jgi:hypothetical protein